MRHTPHHWSALILVCLGSMCMSAAGDIPHIGRWKLNPAKSDFGGLTLAFESSAPGTLRSSINGSPFSTATLDGRDVPIHSGYTSASRQVDDHTWSSTTKLNGAVISTSQTQLSRDNRTLVVAFTDIQPDGKTSTNRLTYTRTSGTTDLVGTWRAKAVSQGEEVIEFVRRGDRLMLLVDATNAIWDAKLDGKDYLLTGPTLPAGGTVSLSQTGPRSILLVQKQDGRIIARSVWTVSADGRTLTESVLDINGGARKATKVYDRE